MMKLSEAITLGATLEPQSRLGHMDGVCAMQAACLAIGLRKDHWGTHHVTGAWPFITMKATHPVSGMTEIVEEIIWSLNDMHRWTRPQIAAWVATIEPAEPQEPQEVQEVQEEVTSVEPILSEETVTCKN